MAGQAGRTASVDRHANTHYRRLVTYLAVLPSEIERHTLGYTRRWTFA
jgi:hypothetical protein